MASAIVDPELKKLLTEWNLSQYYEHFMGQKVNYKILRILEPQHIRKLFESLPVGDQAIFEQRLEIFKRSMLLEECLGTKLTAKVETMQSTVNSPVSSIAPVPAKRKKLSIDMENDSITAQALLDALESNDSVDSQIEEISNGIPQPFVITTPTAKTIPLTPRSVSISSATAPVIPRHIHAASSVVNTVKPPARDPNPILPTTFKHNLPCRYDLMKILTETSGGQLILNYYAKHQHLREEYRTALINVIARYIDANGCTLTLSESNQLESQIVDIFPTEKAEFYRTARRGRIYNKIANMKRIYNKFNKDSEEPANGSLTQQESTSSSSFNIKEEDEYGDVYTEHNIDDFRAKAHSTGSFHEFWKRSQPLRLKQINEIESLQEILTRWPEYRESNIAEWVAMDFAAKFPTATKLSQVFHDNLTKLEKLLFTKVSTSSAAFKYLQLYQKSSTESQHLILMYVLHQLFPPKHHTVVENGVKCKKRYSIQDSQNAAIYIQNSHAAIDQFLSTKTTATPPMLLVVGEMGGDIEEVSVYFEGVCYPMASVALAAELCCELFFLFNIDFPEESVLLYHFMQTFFLNIEPENKNSRIYTTINDLNAY